MSPQEKELDHALAETFPASDPTTPSSPTTSISEGTISASDPATSLLLYRVVRAEEADSAFAAQPHYPAGRWTSEGTPAIYASLSEATALLEFLAHLEGALPEDAVLVAARVPAELAWRDPPLPGEWHRTPYDAQVQQAGDRWLRAGRAPVILVPSVLAHSELNALVAPEHPETVRLDVVGRRPLPIDRRLRP
jgi:RES domain-containing protein